MRKIKTLIALLFLIASTSFGQNCNCESTFNWTKATFENNDAGFQYSIDTKGKTAYETHNKIFSQKVKKIKTGEECQKAIYEWLTFFRAGHFNFKQNASNPKNIQTGTSNWETVDIDIKEFEKYLSTKKEADLEGIWITDSYTVGIKKIDNQYKGFIIKTDVTNWKEKEVKFKISLDEKSCTYYWRNRSKTSFDDIKLLEKNYLEIDYIKLRRILPKFKIDEKIENYFRVLYADKPFIEELNNTTLLFRVSSFNDSQKKYIDSVILANKSKILKTENLIIDLRNNGGGSDISYKELIPFLYTNPIREVGMEFRSTKLNNQRMLDQEEYGLNEDEKKWAKTSYDTLQKHLGKFVNLDVTKISVQKLDTIYSYPKSIGIIINKANGSTAEQFLLVAKQSKKVKLFGTTTFGVLDISNMYSVNSPCGEYELGYSLSKSYRIPEMTIDGKGIQPDYYIDKEIEEYDWVDYVNKILNQK